MESRCFVGFGFGPIQSGLMLLEAYRSGRFARLVVAEVNPALVGLLRKAGGTYAVNIAHAQRIEQATVKGIEAFNPANPTDRAALVAAIAEADELATALPSVDFYARGGASSVAAVLADGIAANPARPRIVYAAENNNDAADRLTAELRNILPEKDLGHFQALDTVIGKMSGVIDDAAEMREVDLAPLTRGADRAVLVEAFNRILISAVTLDGFHRGIEAFIEKPRLNPFEEAKLFGHNAVHALLGYLGHRRGLTVMSQAADHPDLMETARRAFIDECGAALVARHGHGGDPLFTADGFRAYAEDLLTRMTNPFLRDRVDRVIRDPARKLGWNDRFFGAVRACTENGIEPAHLSRGAAAALEVHLGHAPASAEETGAALRSIWGDQATAEGDAAIAATWGGLRALR